MLAACRLAGLSALILDYAGGLAVAQRSAGYPAARIGFRCSKRRSLAGFSSSDAPGHRRRLSAVSGRLKSADP